MNKSDLELLREHCPEISCYLEKALGVPKTVSVTSEDIKAIAAKMVKMYKNNKRLRKAITRKIKKYRKGFGDYADLINDIELIIKEADDRINL